MGRWGWGLLDQRDGVNTFLSMQPFTPETEIPASLTEHQRWMWASAYLAALMSGFAIGFAVLY